MQVLALLPNVITSLCDYFNKCLFADNSCRRLFQKFVLQMLHNLQLISGLCIAIFNHLFLCQSFFFYFCKYIFAFPGVCLCHIETIICPSGPSGYCFVKLNKPSWFFPLFQGSLFALLSSSSTSVYSFGLISFSQDRSNQNLMKCCRWAVPGRNVSGLLFRWLCQH